jgi:hypothetical protein
MPIGADSNVIRIRRSLTAWACWAIRSSVTSEATETPPTTAPDRDRDRTGAVLIR